MLNNDTGQAVTGLQSITFSLYGDGGALFWTEQQPEVSLDSSGRFSVTLGSNTSNPLDPRAFTGTTFIGIQVGTEPVLVPRQQLTSVAYAFQSFLGGVPAGVIVMWSGAVVQIPEGWALCDGNNDTPDLRNRFILGAGDRFAPDSTGGEETHVLTIEEMPTHDHGSKSLTGSLIFHGQTSGTALQDAHGIFSGSSYIGDKYHNNESSSGSFSYGVANIDATHGHDSKGSDQAHNNMPPYFALAYIMKL